MSVRPSYRGTKLGRSEPAPSVKRLPAQFRLSNLLLPEMDDTGVVLHGFETEADALREDRKRVELIVGSVSEPLSSDPRVRAGSRESTDAVCSLLEQLDDLVHRLQLGIEGDPQETLASALHMRSLRERVCGALLEALNSKGNASLRIVTLINTTWAYSADQLNSIRAAAIKGQLRTHLERVGILDMTGPLIGFLHGEFEPNSRIFQLHWHLVTTPAKAAALKKRLKGRLGYEKTITGSNPIVRQEIRNRPRQLSYLLKSYLPEKAVVMVNGARKRARDEQRIKEPFHTQVLLWLDQQHLTDIMLLNGCIYRSGKFHLK